MAYVDYTYYTGTYLGNAISATAFPALAQKASNWIDRACYGRVAAIITAGTDTIKISAIKNGVCAVAEQMNNESLTGSLDGLQSESQGQYSVSYGKTAQNSKSNLTKRIRAAREWLDVTMLMYPGFLDGEYGSGL